MAHSRLETALLTESATKTPPKMQYYFNIFEKILMAEKGTADQRATLIRILKQNGSDDYDKQSRMRIRFWNKLQNLGLH